VDKLHWDEVAELGAVIVGKARGRRGDEEVTLFKSVGLAVEDVAVAARVYETAKRQGVGRTIDW
jgi:ornithine cyclodeaminase/alanine dehydrogenase-like protein (mu-crystallin family)